MCNNLNPWVLTFMWILCRHTKHNPHSSNNRHQQQPPPARQFVIMKNCTSNMTRSSRCWPGSHDINKHKIILTRPNLLQSVTTAEKYYQLRKSLSVSTSERCWWVYTEAFVAHSQYTLSFWVAQWCSTTSHNKKIPSLIHNWDLSVWRCSSFLPQSKHIPVRLTGDSKLDLLVR